MLGPLLFLIYINDIVNSTTLVLFADDSNILIVDETMKRQLAGVNEYTKYNQLHINVGKSF